MAAQSGHAEVLRLLLAHPQTDVNQADKLGRTPLILGLLSGAGTEAVEVMLELGEDPRKEDQVASVAYSVLLCRVILM